MKAFKHLKIGKAFKHLRIGKAPGLSEVHAEMILVSGCVGIRALMELCQRILDGKRMPPDWATSVAIPIFNGKVNIMNCCMYRGMKLLEDAIKIVERYLRKD